MEAVLQQKVREVANHVEQQLDAELEKLDNLDISDYEQIRAHRLNELKQMQKQKQNWLTLVMYHDKFNIYIDIYFITYIILHCKKILYNVCAK